MYKSSPYEIKHCVSIDWGTSRFRMRLVDCESVEIVNEIQSNFGIKSMYRNWSKNTDDRIAHFMNYVVEQMEKLGVKGMPPIIISGMASSTIGLKELPYAPLPFSCSGSGLYVEKFTYGSLKSVYLVSGVSAPADVIRGEETELLGVYQEADNQSKTCYIFPGTHSKHMICHDGWVIDFCTYMTGEMYEVISKHTILSASLEQADGQQIVNKNAFTKGVDDAQHNNLLNSLFKIRANQLLHAKSKVENADYLSGLLIGSELCHLKSLKIEQIKLCASHNLGKLYALAAGFLQLNFSTLAEDQLEKATVLGQLKLLKLHGDLQ